MAGIYIHIPFCRSRCIYCGFYSTTGLELRQRYVDAVCKEMMIRDGKLEVRGEKMPIETIYFGGGTPSQLTIEQLRQLLIYINKVEKDAEITIEVNPDAARKVRSAIRTVRAVGRNPRICHCYKATRCE